MMILRIASYILLLLYLVLGVIFYLKQRREKKSFIGFSMIIIAVFCLITILGSSNYKQTNDMNDKDSYMLKLEQIGTPQNIIIRAMSEKRYEQNSNDYEVTKVDGDVELNAYVDNAAPQKSSTIYLMVLGPEGGKVNAICHYKTGDRPYMGVIGRDGKLILPINTGDAESGYTVVIDVLVDYNGRHYKTNAAFTPK